MKPGGSLRVLHVDSEIPWRGGERQVIELMLRQRAMGDDPHLTAPRRSALAERAAEEQFAVHRVPMRGTWDLGSALAIARLHRALRPQVVHWHAARAHALGALAALFAPGPARILSRRVDFPVRRSPGSRLLYALPIDSILAISGGVRDALIGSGVPASRIQVVPSGIDLEPFQAPFDRPAVRRRLGLTDGELLILNVAALAPHKSQTDLLRAAASARARRPDLRFWIAGEGPLRAALEAEHRALKLGDSVRFLGFRDDATDLLRAADLFVISSYLEGLGTSILDAMAAGLAVVATRVGGIPEVVDQATGILVPPHDPEALAAAILELAGDPARRASLGARGRERARAFSADATAERTREAYLRALRG
ncbi:MAG TPA: glycosyltransferase [Candidatus Eisenbacteria bacterium]|nr:glycosyltransferase [Candidatus Eisenbacteria bacterium]